VRRALLVLLVALAACSARSHAVPLEPGEATIVRVIDGDTIVVHLSTGDESVRMIGVDTPEEVKPNTPVECYATEAAARTAELLPAGTRVRLERDQEARAATTACRSRPSCSAGATPPPSPSARTPPTRPSTRPS
jgi:micrococcal nuclease